MAKAEELQKASQTQKDDKIVSFDCRVRPKDELTGWIRNHKPSEMKKSDKIGYLMVLSKRLTSGMAHFMFSSVEDPGRHCSKVNQSWSPNMHLPLNLNLKIIRNYLKMHSEEKSN